jgi:hypothetical protein
MRPSTMINILFAIMPLLQCLALKTYAQSKTSHAQQIWFGYMTTERLSENYSIWNDIHLVPESFAIVRTGLSRNILNTGVVTAGYAFLWLPVGRDTKLQRHEHRPWAQFQISSPVGKSWNITHRIRYDARFKQNVKDGILKDGFGFNHRVRFLFSLRKNLAQKSADHQLYVVISDEVLLNFGSEITYNTFDQNRLSLSFGVQSKQTQYQIGLMNRFVQTAQSKYTLNHTLVARVIQKFDLRKVLHGDHHHEIISE